MRISYILSYSILNYLIGLGSYLLVIIIISLQSLFMVCIAKLVVSSHVFGRYTRYPPI